MKPRIERVMLGAYDRKLASFKTIAKRGGLHSAVRVAAVDLAASMEFLKTVANQPGGAAMVKAACVDLELMSLEKLERERAEN